MIITNYNTSGEIPFLGMNISINVFLYVMGALAVIIFLILLAILLIMYLRKRWGIKGYLSLEEKDYQVEDKILQIEHEISKIQRKFYSNRYGAKKSRSIFK